MKKQSGFEVLKAGTQTVGKDYLRPGFLMGAVLKCYAIERHFRGCEYKTLTHLCFARSKLHKIKGFLPLNANIDYDKLRAKAVYCFRPLDYSQARTETAVKDAKREVYP